MPPTILPPPLARGVDNAFLEKERAGDVGNVLASWGQSDMEFVQKFTPPDFQVKNFTPSILPNFNSFSKKKTQKMSENGEIYTAGKNFTLPPALTGWTNSTSD